jgi:multidrug efflux pump subunit AcrA (membrane-fusion protein)
VAGEREGRLRRRLAAARGRRTLAAAAVGAALLAAGALALLLGGSDGGTAAGASPAAGAVGRVERRTLAERLTATGTIGYAGETTVFARLPGTVTALPGVGDSIRRGGRLYALDGEPVLLMYGAVPAYRALAVGVDEGRDVEQLERNLAALGYEPGSVDERFTSATAAALAAWQEDLGLEPSGELALGRVAFLRGPQRVTGLEATLGEAVGGGGAAGGETMVAWHPEAETAVEAAEEAGEGEMRSGEAPTHGEQPQSKHAEQSHPDDAEHSHPNHAAHLPSNPESGSREEPEPRKEPQPRDESEPRLKPDPAPQPEALEEPEPEPPSIPVLRTSSTRRVVSVELEADQQSIAHRGQRVQVVLPGGAEVPGRVRALTAVEASGGEGGPGEEAEPGVEATISVTGRRRIPALDGATVNVRFVQEVRRQVLSVPLTALIAIGGGRFAVYVRGDGARERIVVTPGLAADGYVEVAGKGLRAGMTVEAGE